VDFSFLTFEILYQPQHRAAQKHPDETAHEPMGEVELAKDPIHPRQNGGNGRCDKSDD